LDFLAAIVSRPNAEQNFMSELKTETANPMPTEPGYYWVRNPDFKNRPGADEWTVVHINLLKSDFHHLKEGELVVGVNNLEMFARANRFTEFVRIYEPGTDPQPVDLLLYCPNCGRQHVDQPQPEKDWSNPSHRSHECQHCFWKWRPADVPTNGIAELQTKGKNDGDAQPCQIAVRRISKSVKSEA
jgi:hypothetical protein